MTICIDSTFDFNAPFSFSKRSARLFQYSKSLGGSGFSEIEKQEVETNTISERDDLYFCPKNPHLSYLKTFQDRFQKHFKLTCDI